MPLLISMVSIVFDFFYNLLFNEEKAQFLAVFKKNIDLILFKVWQWLAGNNENQVVHSYSTMVDFNSFHAISQWNPCFDFLAIYFNCGIS